MLLLSNDDVRSVLTMPLVLDALKESYLELYRGESVCVPSISCSLPIGRPDAFFRWTIMEGGSPARGYFAFRLQSDIWYRQEYGSEHGGGVTDRWYSTKPGKFCGLIILARVENAEPVAIIQDSVISRARVGADGAIGTDALARRDAEVLGVLGSGGMARTHVAANLLVRNIKRVQVFSPTRAHREQFVREVAEQYGVEAVALDHGADAFRGADIVAGCTDGGFTEEGNAVIVGRWLEPGTHYTTVQSGIDAEAKRRTAVSLVLGRAPGPLGLPQLHSSGPNRVTYAVPAGNPKFKGDAYYAEAHSEGGLGEGLRGVASSRVIAWGDLESGAEEGRTAPDEITYSTRGNVPGAQFHAVAGRVYELAKAQGLGREIPTEWFLQDERN